MTQKRSSDVKLTETVYAVRASTADGATCDLLLFAQLTAAARYVEQLRTLPLGFDGVAIVERKIIGTLTA
jgi:hypothetical protein